MRKLFVLLLTALLLGGVIFAQDDAEDVAEDVGEAIEDTADGIGDAAEEAADEVGDAMEGDMMASDLVAFNSSQWIGASTGFPFGLVLHYGINDLIAEDIDLRANLSALSFGGAFSFAGGADALYNLPIDMEGAPFNIYAGGGITLGYALGDDGGLSAGLRGVGGAEYIVFDPIGLIAEVRAGVITVSPFFSPGFFLGANYHF